MPSWAIERAGPESWERVRALRLSALRESPDAFASTAEREKTFLPERWRARLESTAVATFVAVSEGGALGLVVGGPYRDREDAAGLFSLWVAPEARSRGAASALVDAVVAWVRTSGYERVVLDVADSNLAALRLYERKGFMATGVAGALPPPREHVREHQRVLELLRGPACTVTARYAATVTAPASARATSRPCVSWIPRIL